MNERKSKIQGLERWYANLEHWLRRRSADLASEVRDYPTPIARCDEQLTRLLEQQREAFDTLDRVQAAGAMLSRSTPVEIRSALRNCLEAAVFSDPAQGTLRTRFLAELASLSEVPSDARTRRGGCAPSTVWNDDGGHYAA